MSEFRRKYELRRALASSRRSLVEEVELIQAILDDLEAALQAADAEWVSLDEAADISGYSKKQLVRLADSDESQVTSRGQNRSRQFRRGSLPQKHSRTKPGGTKPEVTRPGKTTPQGTSAQPTAPLAPPSNSPYDPRADAHAFARRLASTKRGAA